MEGLNIRHLLIVSLGYATHIHDEIDKIYDKKRWDYYEIFKNGGFYNDVVIQSFSTVKEEKMKKVAGIVGWCYKHNDFRLIDHLIKKGYKDVVRYYQTNQHRLDLHEFSHYMFKRKEDYGHPSEQDLTMCEIVLLYLAYRDGVDITQLLSTPYGNMILDALNHLIIDIGQSFLVKHALNESEDKMQEIINFIETTLNIDFNKMPRNADILFDTIINNQLDKEISENRGLKYVTVDETRKIRDTLFYDGIVKHIGAYSTTLRLTNLNYNDLLNVKITKEELMAIAFNTLNRIEGNNYNKEEIEQFFIASICIIALTNQYKLQKEVVIDDSNEAWYADVQRREKELQEKEIFYKKNQENHQIELTKESNRANKASEENKILLKEIERLKKENQAFEEEREELIELRSFAYNQKRIDFTIEEVDVIEASKQLNDKKIVVCGGHPNMHRKIKEWIPSLEVIDTDTLNKNLSYLKKYDLVYFYPNYANHSFYKKIKAGIKGSNTKFVYLQDVDNLEFLIMDMYESIKSS